jgi:hypothetical protein
METSGQSAGRGRQLNTGSCGHLSGIGPRHRGSDIAFIHLSSLEWCCHSSAHRNGGTIARAARGSNE